MNSGKLNVSMEELTLQSYREQVKNLQQISKQNALGVIVNKLQYRNGYANVVISASKNLSESEIIILCERFNELISIVNVARYYLSEAVKESYNQDVLESQDITRNIHLYTADLWYNSIIDSIYQFYYLLSNADKITDGNYKKMLKKVRYEKDKEKVIKEIPTEEEREGFKSLVKNLGRINETANEIKHREFNIYFQDPKQKNHSICVLRNFRINSEGNKLKTFGDFADRISTKTLQPELKEFTSFFDLLMNADKDICTYLNIIATKNFKIEAHDNE